MRVFGVAAITRIGAILIGANQDPELITVIEFSDQQFFQGGLVFLFHPTPLSAVTAGLPNEITPALRRWYSYK
jgi:hypothetical protein